MSAIKSIRVTISIEDHNGTTVSMVTRKKHFATTEHKANIASRVIETASDAAVAASRGAGLNV